VEITKSEAQGRVPVTIFHIDGAFNSDEPLAGMVKEAVEGGARNILLDLTGASYISSAGLRVLHTTYTVLRDSWRPRNPSAPVCGRVRITPPT
jgi:anti-anti-sigma regulatory factor